MNPSDLIDISIPIASGMIHWPGDPEIAVTMVCDVAQGDAATVRHLSLGSHTGTHVDAPCHFLPGAATLSDLPLSAFCGPVRVVEILNTRAIIPDHLEAVLGHVPIGRVLFKTDNSARRWFEYPFDEQFVHLTPAAAQWLVDRDVTLVGMDYLSVDGFAAAGAPVHHILLGRQVAILEGLYLGDVTPGEYELLAMPLPIADGDGAPARAALRRLPAHG